MKLRPLAFVIGAIIVLSGAALLWWRFSLGPVNESETKTVSFSVERGDGVREIANKLHDAGLIKDPVGFFLLVKKLGIEKNIQAGEFQLSPSWGANDIARTLTIGTQDLWITIPEGLRSEEILAYLQKTNPGGWDSTLSTQTAWKKDEGKLFPETYRVPAGHTLDSIRELLVTTFDTSITDQMKADANKDGYTFEQRLIVASLIEREVRHPEDRPIVAGIMYNRLKEDMRLDIDATVQYAVGNAQNGWWKKDLTQQDLEVDSPYNTRLHGGLPPTPICNPGAASIRAAIYPTKTDYLYYVSDSSGVNHYAKTLEEHNRNVAKYL